LVLDKLKTFLYYFINIQVLIKAKVMMAEVNLRVDFMFVEALQPSTSSQLCTQPRTYLARKRQ